MKPQAGTMHHGRMGRNPDHDPLFRRFVIVSLVVHLAFLVAAGTMTLIRFSGTTYSPAYTVDLISVPGPPVEAPPAARTAPAPAVKEEKPPVPKAETKPAPRPAAEKPVARPRDIKAPPVPHEGDEAARSDRRKKLEELERKAQELFEQFSVREEVTGGDAGDRAPGERADGETLSDAASRGAAGGGRAGEPSNLLYRAYYDRIYAHIYAVWNPPENVTRDSDIVTVVRIRIAPNGTIERHWIETKSGNIYYDESVIRAVRAADPLPPIPTELGNQPLEVGLNFLPSGR